ncbi:MAG: PKD repeat protein [Saprospiraceae bacterium]|jgi:PKD repeat protein
MKNIKILATALICFFALNTIQSQTYFYLDNITFSPDPLTSTEEICVTVSGNKSTPCVYLEPDAGLSEVGGNLVLNMCFQDAPCAQVLQPWDTTFCYGFLEPGAFNLLLEGCNYSGMGTVIEGEVVGGNANPVAEFSNDVSFGCADLPVNFMSTSVNADMYEWNFGDGNTSTEQNPTHIYTQLGDYTVTLTVYNSADPENVSTVEFIDLIQVIDEILIDLGEDILLPVDGMIDLMPAVSALVDEFLWSDGSIGQILTVNAAELQPGSSNTYSVTVTSGNCTATDEVVVMVEGTNATFDKELLNTGEFYPNPTSDLLYLLEENITMACVYDLNGKKVGEWRNANTIDVKNLTIGVYLIELTTEAGVKFGRFLKM